MDRAELRLPPQDEQKAMIEDASSWPSTGCWVDKPFNHGNTPWVLYGNGESIGAGFEVAGNTQINITEGHTQADGGFRVTFTNDGPRTTGTIWVMYR